MEINWSHIFTMGLLQSTGTHLAWAVRMEHSGGTWAGRARTKPCLWSLNSTEFPSGKPMHRVRLGKYLSGTKWTPTLGPGPDLNMTNFIFRETLRNILWGLFLLLFGFWGYVGGEVCHFFKLQHGCFSPSAPNHCRAGMDALVISLAGGRWNPVILSSLSCWPYSHRGFQNTQLFFPFSPSL